VSVQDASGKSALDYCSKGGAAHGLLFRHFTRLEQRAQRIAAELLQEEESAAKCTTGSGDGKGKGAKGKKKKGAVKKEKAAAAVVKVAEKEVDGNDVVQALEVRAQVGHCQRGVRAVLHQLL
jgi:hypothetical protein